MRTCLIPALLLCGCACAQVPANNTSKTGSPCSVAVSGNNNVVNLPGCDPSKIAPADRLRKLKASTLTLAQDIINFAESREGPTNQWIQEAIAQSMLDSIKNRPDGAAEFRERKRAYDQKTRDEFLKYYWPRLQALEVDLTDAGVSDLTPISWAVASDDPRRIGFMLSVVGERIGKKPPFGRTLTKLEANDIFQESNGSIEVQVFAYLADDNAREIAETLRGAIEKNRWKVNGKVLPLDDRLPRPQGVVMIFPSADWTSEENQASSILATIEACDLELKVEVHSARQPPTIFRVEIWPEGSGPRRSPPLLQP